MNNYIKNLRIKQYGESQERGRKEWVRGEQRRIKGGHLQ